MKVSLELQTELVKAVSNVFYQGDKPRPAFLGTNVTEKSKHIIEGVVDIVKLIEKEEKFYYFLVGYNLEDFGEKELEDFAKENEFEVGKYSSFILDFSLLKKVESYGSYIIISEEEYNILK